MIEKLVDVYRITEMRDNSIYKTRFIEDRWVPLGEQPPPGYIYTPKSTDYAKNNQTIRRVK